MKYLVYLVFVFATVFFAIPRIFGNNYELSSQIFSVTWILFALVIIGSYLDKLVDVDHKKKKELDRLHRYNQWKKEQRILKSQRKRVRRFE